MKLSTIFFAIAAVLCSAATQAQETVEDYFDLSIEELVNILVVSPSKSEQSLRGVAAAIHVVTAEEIERMGVTTLPEVLRFVPGMIVSRLDSSNWAVSARGLAHHFSDKLLVLVDGRSVYNPLFTGVYWEMIDIPLETIKRIEVIRGPGGAVWGANAVNGIINVVTKKASEVRGTSANIGLGLKERAQASLQQGFQIDDRIDGRLYASHQAFQGYDYNEVPLAKSFGNIDENDWQRSSFGSRLDYEDDALTVELQGDVTVFNGNVTSTAMLIQQDLDGPFAALENKDASGKMANLRLGINYTPSSSRKIALTSYLMREDRDDASKFLQNRLTYDIDTQIDQTLFKGNTLQLGLGARWILDETITGPSAGLFDPKRTLKFFSAFLQDNQKFFDENLTISLGAPIQESIISQVYVPAT